MHFRESNFHKFSGGACPWTPLETRTFGPSVYRGARLLCHENPPTSKLNETPDRPVVGFFDRFNALSSNILLTFGCYFDNPQCPGVGHLNGNSQLSSNAPPMPPPPPAA